jgi:hypothetical protein
LRRIWDEILEQEAEAKDKPNTSESEIGAEQILGMRISELSKRSIAIKIYSDVLGCEVWLSGTEEMANQLRQDDPEAVIYTAAEMRRLIKLNLTSEDLKRIDNVKTVLPGSKVVDSRLKEVSDEPDRT